jgi:hypothetical protein
VAADDADGEGDVWTRAKVKDVDGATGGAEGVVVSRRERGLVRRGGGVEVAVVSKRHREGRRTVVEHAVLFEELLSGFLVEHADNASGEVTGDVHAHNGGGISEVSNVELLTYGGLGGEDSVD